MKLSHRNEDNNPIRYHDGEVEDVIEDYDSN